MSVDTKRLRELHAAATPGPWRYLVDDATVDGMIDGIVDGDGDDIVKTDCGIYPPRLEDAQLIVTLVNQAPALLDELEKLRAVHGIVSQESELDRLRRLEAADLEMEDAQDETGPTTSSGSADSPRSPSSQPTGSEEP